MPYNFELTFTQPILAKLDAGRLRDAQDWANTITNAYINTIKLGLPQGVPPTLPAPGLNPIAPPPYPITVSGFNTADSRRNIMYNIIFAYFKAKEAKLNKDEIQNIIVDIKRLQKQIRQKRAEIKSAQQQVKNITSELRNIRKTFKDIVQSVKEDIKSELNSLDQIVKDVTNLASSANIQDITNIYSAELSLINRLKNIGNLQNVSDAIILANDFNTLQNNFETKDSTKRYLQRRLIATGSSVLGWVNGINNLPLLLSKINRYDYRYKVVKKFISTVKLLETQLAIFEKKIIDLTDDLKNKLLKKLEAYRKNLAEKRANKKKSRANDLFKAGRKLVVEDRKLVETQLKKVKDRVKKINNNISVVSKLGGRVVGVTISIEKEVKLLVQELKRVKNAANDTVDRSEDVVKLREYLNQNGLSSYIELLTTAFVQSQSDFQTFKSLFESRKLRYVQIYKEIKLIHTDAKKLLNNKFPKLHTRINKLGTSLKELFLLISIELQPALQEVKDIFNSQKKELEDFAKKVLNKVKKQGEEFLKSLIPVKSDVVDPIEKSKARKEKLIVYKDYIQRSKALSKYTSELALGVKGLANLGSNISNSNYRYSDNDVDIRNVVNAIYTLRGFEEPAGRKAYLAQEKKRLLSEFNRLFIVELLFDLIVGIINELNSNDGLSLFENDIERLRGVIPDNEYESCKYIIKLLKSKPASIKDFIKIVEGVNFKVLSISKYKKRILNLEKYYLRRSKQAIQTALDGCEKYNITNAKINSTLLKLKTILKKEDSFVLYALEIVNNFIKDFINLIGNVLSPAVDSISKFIKEKIIKENRLYEQLKAQTQKKLVNLDALAMSTAFGLAARLFWTGATWFGPTGVNHVVFNIGLFKPIKARMNDGASKYVRELAKSYEKQLQIMNGLVIPPPNTLIPPIPFVGYK